MFNRLKFLISMNSPVKLFFSYFKTYVFYKIYKSKILNHNEEWRRFLNEKKITVDWFSFKSFFFYLTLKNLKKFSYLEIGCFEGNSFLYVMSNFHPEIAYAVDTWKGSDEHQNSEHDLEKVEKNFDFNLLDFSENFIKIKNNSKFFFKENKFFFDIIYVDGSHSYIDVLNDLEESWKILNLNGVLICDDYFFSYYKEKKKLPANAINAFINKNNQKCKITYFTKHQIFIKKIKN